jgi:hypothetical protein
LISSSFSYELSFHHCFTLTRSHWVHLRHNRTPA